MTSRQKILLGCFAMALAIVGDFLLGYGTFSMTNDPNVPMGIAASVVPDWRYAASSVLGFLCVPFFAVAALELLKVMEQKYGLREQRLYKLFKIANWGGILYFAFIHIGICMLPVVFNAGMAATGDAAASVGMMLRVLKSIAVPMIAGFIVCDGFVGNVILKFMEGVAGTLMGIIKKEIFADTRGKLGGLLGQLMNLIAEGLDSGFESFGWLLLYWVCAMKLVGKEERI